MKKILHVFNTFLPKTEIWAFHLLSHIPNVDQEIFAIHRNTEIFDSLPFHMIESRQGPLLRKTWNLSYNNLTDIFKRVIYKYKIWTRPTLSQELYKYIQDTQPNLLHFHFGDLATKFLSLIITAKIPMCISFYGHDYEFMPKTNPELINKYKSLFSSNAHFVCEGEHGKMILEKLGCPPSKIHVLPLGIEINNFSPLIKPKSTLNLIQIASFTEKKGQIYTVKAVHQASKKYPDIRCTLIGDKRDPEYYRKVFAYIERYGLQKIIQVKDFVPYSEISSYLRSNNVFIHPSCYAENLDCEGGAPVILMDAQNAGLPVISTTHCDIPSVVIDKISGKLTPEKNVAALTDSICYFYEMDENAYSDYSAAAIFNVRSNYNIKENAAKFSAFYNKIQFSA